MHPEPAHSFTAAQIAEWVGGRLAGSPDLRLSGMQTLAEAQPGELSYVGQERLKEEWNRSRASAALAGEGLALEPGEGRALIFVRDVDLAVAIVLEKLAPTPTLPAPGVHPSAVVDPSAQIDPTARIGPLCQIGPGAQIGARTVLQGQVAVLDGSRVGSDCVLWPGVVIRERCELGDGCILHPNVTVGSDGFGYRPSADGRGLVKIPQIGTVKIGRGVEIGSGTCIDRGKFGATVIGDGTKIDNLCHIAHNCLIGRSVVMAACSGVAGSTRVEDGVIMGGRVGIIDHLVIGRGSRMGAGTLVMQDVPPGATVVGYPAIDAKIWKRLQVLLKKLPETMRRLGGRTSGTSQG